MRRASLLLALSLFASPPGARADSTESYRPDPAAVQRYGPAYRYPQDGWIVLHIEGKPYERGYQHGRLMSKEIAALLRCFATTQGPRAPTEAWESTRTLTNALFLRRMAPEYLEEMKGIAEGASAAGARIHDRPIDLVDIVALNCWPEIEHVDSALAALPTGLEGKRFPPGPPKAMPKPTIERCSAFAATGPATADGKIVFGHITMFSLYPSNHFNVWLDIKPDKGHRMLMCGYPGAMQSGMDYYLNDAGLLIAETTITQTVFDMSGMSETSRIRQAIQYASTIDGAVAILQKENNGMYTNEWLLADINTNEIALFEQGTHKTKLHRSSKNDWIGGTTGFYWGCNNTKDVALRLETVPGVNGRPANLVFSPSPRDRAWQRLYHKYQGKIDVAFAKEAFTSPPIAAFHSLDAKFTTTDMAKELKSWALFGPPLGRTWQPTFAQRKLFPEIKPLVSNPWTILNAAPPVGGALLAVDIPSDQDKAKEPRGKAKRKKKNADRIGQAYSWRGTILPASDADIWLATAFADYERIVTKDKNLRDARADGDLAPEDRDELAVALFNYRSRCAEAAFTQGMIPLVGIKSNTAHDDWYRLASGKGVLVLNELRRLLGDAKFADVMDAFGRENAGKRITTAQFEDHLKHTAGNQAAALVASWVKESSLPKLRLEQLMTTSAPSVRAGKDHDSADKRYVIHGAIHRDRDQPIIANVDVTVETDQGEITKTVKLTGPMTEFKIVVGDGAPKRVLLDKYGQTALAGMRPYSIQSFAREQDRTLIVYGTLTEAPTNREAAEALQKAIRASHYNFTVPIKADTEASEDDLKANHLLLIGRPDSNALVKRWLAKLPIAFGPHSFVVRGKTYAHPGSAVMAATANPLNPNNSLVVIAGLGAASTLDAAPKLGNYMYRPAEVLVLPNGEGGQLLVLPGE